MKSTNGPELLYALRRLGWRTWGEALTRTWRRPTLRQWVQEFAADGAIALVLVASHWVVVTGTIVGCSMTENFVPITQHTYRRKRVRYSVFVAKKALG